MRRGGLVSAVRTKGRGDVSEKVYVATVNYGGYGRIILGVYGDEQPAHRIVRDTLDKYVGIDGWEISGEQYVKIGAKAGDQVIADVQSFDVGTSVAAWVRHFDEVKRIRDDATAS